MHQVIKRAVGSKSNVDNAAVVDQSNGDKQTDVNYGDSYSNLVSPRKSIRRVSPKRLRFDDDQYLLLKHNRPLLAKSMFLLTKLINFIYSK